MENFTITAPHLLSLLVTSHGTPIIVSCVLLYVQGSDGAVRSAKQCLLYLCVICKTFIDQINTIDFNKQYHFRILFSFCRKYLPFLRQK